MRIKYFRLNREHFSKYRLTLDIENKSLEIVADNNRYRVNENIKSIYYRQPVFLRNTPSEALTINEQLVRSQWMAFLRSLTIFDSARWLNHPKSTYLAETKAYQLCVASEIGFAIPKTLIGNNAIEFQKFHGDVIIKSLDTVLLRDGGECLFTYSTLKNTRELNDVNVRSAPLTVQEYITPKVDVRVTVIGSKLFAVKITSNGEGIKEDWRVINRDILEYKNIKLPNFIGTYCFELMNKLNLNFGAIDFIFDNEVCFYRN